MKRLNKAEAIKALAENKRQMVEARRAGDDERARKLSQAKQKLKKRAHINKCWVCGVTINAGATFCGIHKHTRRTLLGGGQTEPAEKKVTRNNNRRIAGAPAGGVLAEYGYYAPAVQKVVKKWKGEVGQDLIERIFPRVAEAALRLKNELHVVFYSPKYWPLVLDFATAITKTVADEKKARAWLLLNPGIRSVAVDGEYEPFDAMAKRSGIPRASLEKAYQRLRLATPERIARLLRADK